MISQTHRLKSIVVNSKDLTSFIAYLESKINGTARDAYDFSRLEITLRLRDSTTIDLSTKDDEQITSIFSQTLEENIASINLILVRLRTSQVDVTFTAEGRMYGEGASLHIAANDRKSLLVELDECKRLLKWKQAKNHLTSGAFWIQPFISLLTLTWLVLLLYKLFPSSSPLPAYIQQLLLFTSVAISMFFGFWIASFLEKRYSRVVVYSDREHSSPDLRDDWHKVFVPTVLIPILLIIVFAVF